MKKHIFTLGLVLLLALCTSCGGGAGTTMTPQGSGLVDPGSTTSVGTIINNPAKLTVNALAQSLPESIYWDPIAEDPSLFGFENDSLKPLSELSAAAIETVLDILRKVGHEYFTLMNLDASFQVNGVTTFTEDPVVMALLEGSKYSEASIFVDTRTSQTVRVDLTGDDGKVFGRYFVVVDDAGNPREGLFVTINPVEANVVTGLAFSFSDTEHHMVMRRALGDGTMALDIFDCDVAQKACVAEHLKNDASGLRFSWSDIEPLFCVAQIAYEGSGQNLTAPVQPVIESAFLKARPCQQPSPYWEEVAFSSDMIQSAINLADTTAWEALSASTIAEWLTNFSF